MTIIDFYETKYQDSVAELEELIDKEKIVVKFDGVELNCYYEIDGEMILL